MTYFPAIQVYVSARSRGCATARVEEGAGGGPLTQLRAVPQQGRVAANTHLMFTFLRLRNIRVVTHTFCKQAIVDAVALLECRCSHLDTALCIDNRIEKNPRASYCSFSSFITSELVYQLYCVINSDKRCCKRTRKFTISPTNLILEILLFPLTLINLRNLLRYERKHQLPLLRY